MTVEKLIELWNKMMKSTNVQKKYTSMAFGRHDIVGDGWRELILIKENVHVKIIIERNPNGCIISSGNYSFGIMDDILSEQMCIDFNKRGTLCEGTEITIDRINELL